MAYVQMATEGAWQTLTHMHQRQTRSSSVTVSACTVPDCQTWSVYRATARVPTNQTRIPAACLHTYASLFINFTLLEFAAEWEDSNQSNENSTCARVRVAAKILLQNSGESSFHLQAAWSLYLWGPKRKREYGWSEESGCPFHPTVLSLVQIFCCLLWLPYDMNFPTYICKLAFSQLIILDVFCTVRTITVFMCYFQCPLASTWH